MSESNDAKKRSHEKVFKIRESLLTELFKINHIRTMRHIIIAVLIIVCMDIIVYDLTTYGRVQLEFDLFFWVFEGLWYTLAFIWLPMQISSLLVIYAGFYIYADRRKHFHSSKGEFDFLFLFMYLSFMICFIVLPIWNIGELSVCCRIIVLFEQVRILMKMHAFVRSNVPRVLIDTDENKNDSDVPKPIKCPEFSKYAYYMFAPTLIYRDNYPRHEGPIDWMIVLNHFGEVAACMIYVYCLLDRACIPIYSQFKIKQLTLSSYIQLVSLSMLPGGLILLNGFFALLHSWMNAWAEMLKFGDRQFYTDWWNAATFNVYFRKWNILVQDWLYNYIFIDLYELLNRKNKVLANFGVIFISGVVHEYILGFTFGFFYPVVFLLFVGLGFTFLFIRVNNPDSAPWNVFIWIALLSGGGFNLSLFSLEWYARKNGECPVMFDSIVDYFVPRSILCSLYY